MNKQQREALLNLRNTIQAFDACCSEREHTDVGEVWDILNNAVAVLTAILEPVEAKPQQTIMVRVTAIPVEGADLHELDRDVAGSYCYEVDHAADDTAFDLGEAALDRFHSSVAIKVLDDFDIDTEILS